MTGRYAVSIDGKTRSVELEEVEGKLRVVVDGRERAVDIRAGGDGVWTVIEGTIARLIQVDGVATRLTVEVSHPDGEPRICVAELADGGITAKEAGATAGAGQAGPLTLRAPIPGRVVKVLARPGDKVKVGQTLLVLEAMKMENELRAPRAGVVSVITVSEGVAVETGQPLVSLE